MYVLDSILHTIQSSFLYKNGFLPNGLCPSLSGKFESSTNVVKNLTTSKRPREAARCIVVHPLLSGKLGLSNNGAIAFTASILPGILR